MKMYSFPLVSTSLGIMAVGGYDRTNDRHKDEILQLICEEGNEIIDCQWTLFQKRLEVARSIHVVIQLPPSYEICN